MKLALPLSSGVTLRNLLKFFAPQFLPLYSEAKNAQELPQRVVGRLNEIMNTKDLPQGS